MSTEVTDDEKRRYSDYVLSEIRHLAADPPAILWHYTSGTSLLGIIESGELWSTQVSCLNDSTEIGYSAGLLREALREFRRSGPRDAVADILFDHAEAGLSDDASPTSGWFVACFTTEGDDLNQWRGYGNGEGGFAIGLRSAALAKIAAASGTMLLKVNYDPETHRSLAHRVAMMTMQFFREGLAARSGAHVREWTTAFLEVWGEMLGYLAPALKDPAFRPENEWRLVRPLSQDDVLRLRFRAKPSMLSRHLPLKFPPPGKRKLTPTLL